VSSLWRRLISDHLPSDKEVATVGAIRVVALAALVVLPAPALALPPDSLEITCDIDRKAFRSAAGAVSQVTIRLWDDAVRGVPDAQGGAEHVIAMEELIIFKAKTDRFDAQRPRKFAQLRAVLGTEGDSGVPAELCAGNETWIDLRVGNTDFTCDFSATGRCPRLPIGEPLGPPRGAPMLVGDVEVRRLAVHPVLAAAAEGGTGAPGERRGAQPSAGSTAPASTQARISSGVRPRISPRT
jgi:hypothetical protein